MSAAIPPAPDLAAPTFDWVQGRSQLWRRTLGHAAFLAIVLAVSVVLITTGRNHDRLLPLWAVGIGVVLALIVISEHLMTAKNRLAGGPGWLAKGNRGRWVHLDNLVTLRYTVWAGSFWIRLRDDQGHKMWVNLNRLGDLGVGLVLNGVAASTGSTLDESRGTNRSAAKLLGTRQHHLDRTLPDSSGSSSAVRIMEDEDPQSGSG